MQPSLKESIRARPGADDAEVDAGRPRRGQQGRALALAVGLDAAGDVVGITDVVPSVESDLPTST